MKPISFARGLALAIAIGIMLAVPLPVWAECPDKVYCMVQSHKAFSPWENIGTINAPTCFKWWNDGCRPWNCEGTYKQTDQNYWNARCNTKFADKCPDGCVATFPDY